MWYSSPEAVAGGLLIFLLPGFFLSRALFPEWRLTGIDAGARWVETVAFSLVVSVAITILLGSALLNLPGAGFQAAWSDPTLEVGLSAVTVIAAVAAFARGGFARIAPAAPSPEPSAGEDGSWDLLRRSEELARQERRLRHALKASQDPGEVRRITAELDGVAAEAEALRTERGKEYVS